MKKPAFIKVCPKCGSDDVGVNVQGGGTDYFCRKCGYGKSILPTKKDALPFLDVKLEKVVAFKKEVKRRIKARV